MSKYFDIKDFAKITESDISEHNKLLEDVSKFTAQFDDGKINCFLSHSYEDRNLIERIKYTLEKDSELRVFVDWMEEPQRNPNEAANRIKDALNRSHSVLIIKTENSMQSTWVPWEVGYFEALNSQNDNDVLNKIGVLLIEDEANGFTKESLPENCFEHHEYMKRYKMLGKDDLKEFCTETYDDSNMIEDI